MDRVAPARTRKTWDDFPRGFAEYGPPCRLQVEIPYGQILDAGFTDYGEFFACPDYAYELMFRGGMTLVDGRTGSLLVANRYLNAIQLKWKFDTLDVAGTPETICPWGDITELEVVVDE